MKTMKNNDGLYDEYAQLAARIRGGDESAYAEMYYKSQRLVYATCLGVLRDPQDAEDAMQETYLTVYNKIGSLDDDRKFLGWIKMIAANKSLDMYRKKKGDVSYDDAIASEELCEGDDDLEKLPDTYIMNKTKRDVLKQILTAELTDVQYQTVILYYYDELPVEQIAKLMDCPEGTVKTRLKASRIRIRSGIEKYEKENNDSFAAAGAIPFLTRFLFEDAKGLRLPNINCMSIIKDSGWRPAKGNVAKETTGNNAYPKETAVKDGSIQTQVNGGAQYDFAKENVTVKQIPVNGGQQYDHAKDGMWQQNAFEDGAQYAQAGGAWQAPAGSTWQAPVATAAKQGFIYTGIGKFIVGTVAVATLVGAGVGTKVIIDKLNDDTEETEETEETEATGYIKYEVDPLIETAISVETEPEETDSTEPMASVPGVTPVVANDIGLVPQSEVPEYDQLSKLVSDWFVYPYDSSDPGDSISLARMLTSDGGQLVRFSNYFNDDCSTERGAEDPLGLFDPNMSYRVKTEYVEWVEEIIMNLSQEDMDRINSAVGVTPEDPSSGFGMYRSDDGYIYFAHGDAGHSSDFEIADVYCDGEYYYVKAYLFDDINAENDPDYNPAVTGPFMYLTMQYKNYGGGMFWSVIATSYDEPEAIASLGNNSGSSDVATDAVIDVSEGEISVYDLPGYDQLYGFIQLFPGSGFDCKDPFKPYQFVSGEDGSVDNIYTLLPDDCNDEAYIDYSLYFDNCGFEIVDSDPEGRLPEGYIHRAPVSELYWVEEYILNLSDEDMEQMNVSLTSDNPDQWYYLADDGYIYYITGSAGDELTNEFSRAVYDDGYFYFEVYSYSYIDALDDPSYNPAVTGPYCYYTMKPKMIDGELYWTVIRTSTEMPEAFDKYN